MLADSINQYRVRLPAFEGPLDLLLQLVERNSLPITEVSLAEVTESYLRRMEELTVPPEEMSHFLVVASRLLLIKSRYLLPRPHAEAPDVNAEELAEQLRVYRRFKQAAAVLRGWEGRTSYVQILPPAPPERVAPQPSMPTAVLERALRRSLSRIERGLPQGPSLPRTRLRLSDVVARAERLMREQGSVSLEALAGPDATRSELVLSFLALLDLVRRRRATVVQEELFGPVWLYPLEVSQ